MLAYKITQTHDPEKHPVGQVFLEDRWLGKRHEWHRFNRETMCFEPHYTARYLGKITARSNAGKVKQLLALPGMARARRKAAQRTKG